MSSGTVIEEGYLPDGTPYRVWQCHETRKKIGYIKTDRHGRGHRRSYKWIKKQLKSKPVE